MSTGKTSKPADTGNIAANEVANNQKGQPVPLACGRVKLAARWLCAPANQFTRNVKTPAKK